jgi:hypothetical protein
MHTRMNIYDSIHNTVLRAVTRAAEAEAWPQLDVKHVTTETPKAAGHGDLSTNA